jgi:hypothetical protein
VILDCRAVMGGCDATLIAIQIEAVDVTTSAAAET